MDAVKIGPSRQVVIPKKIHDQLGLVPGDFLEVTLEDGKIVLTPKALVDKTSVSGTAKTGFDAGSGKDH